MKTLIFNKKKIFISVGVIIIGLLYYIQLRIIGISIPCYFNLFTGLECPACGITTVAYAILQGDFMRAFHANIGLVLLAPLLIPTLLVCWFKWITNQHINGKILNICILANIIFLIIWGILRNLLTFCGFSL